MKVAFIPKDIDKRILNAVDYFWSTRKGQSARQVKGGTLDQGNRGAVTGGKQLDGFVSLIRYILEVNGVPSEHIFTDTDLELPGYYRPNKKWDLLVIDEKKLIIAIEFKSQVGPSFGNNFNNRTEEAMGSALDIWTAYREGVFGTQTAPWLGYFMVLEDCQKSNEPVKVRSPHFPVLREFYDASYMERYEIFCKKLLWERQYNSACFITTSSNTDGINYRFPKDCLCLKDFMLSMLGVAIAHYSEE